ncbi:hypothetical protein [Tengunoibacter tsumagoiensis]|uniref:Uncharacterized protein n=1 Tax=Tengunoibacter tsumagoiensis TaxID=2014871 RepID=A0A401ZTR8_9CHLR|nr:hypothetical protein [Tengunoibacter tsumagoiensis]GCE10170.1 hypothetical protein KTT_00290 [Tengunoibacter tsumagoiensis]
MPERKEKDELDDVETIPREQAEHEIEGAVHSIKEDEKEELKEAVKKVKGSGSQKSSQKDELDDVETIPREQAQKEIHDAVKKASQKEKK